jgi:plasmid stabilization system protein ParE
MAGGTGEDQEAVTHYTISIRPEAEAEILEAYRYYEDKAEGLGTEFVRAVDACLAFIERNPRASTVVHKTVRRALLRRFPYGIFYQIDAEKIIVLACFHASRDPKQWQRRA